MNSKFTYEPGDLAPSQCVLCRRRTGVATCAAFPGGIPGSIRVNAHDHRRPWPDDGGIRFEPADDAGPAVLDRLQAHFDRPQPPPPGPWPVRKVKEVER